ncbi:MAG: hypothetical protein LBL79_04855 [Prevotella sp.]|jgi:hypothetical protein|nr:hypothetical protein [Prevotella sp.]
MIDVAQHRKTVSFHILIRFPVRNLRFLNFLFPVIANLKGEAIRKEVTGLLRVNPRNDGKVKMTSGSKSNQRSIKNTTVEN